MELLHAPLPHVDTWCLKLRSNATSPRTTHIQANTYITRALSSFTDTK